MLNRLQVSPYQMTNISYSTVTRKKLEKAYKRLYRAYKKDRTKKNKI